MILSKIMTLSESLANRIAAGEVVERPSSVVKELVENAIDAQATTIDIHIEESGLKMIQVVDNGSGIEAEDLPLAFQRHATSKLLEQEDLFRIRTLGFRGEALPSIASVSHVEIESAIANHPGRRLKIQGGDIVLDEPSIPRRGTKITVSNLFYNTPARLKFVKSLQTELANITDMVNRLAMSHPEIAFRLTNDGNQFFQTMGQGTLQQTIANIYSPSIARKMVPISATSLDFKVSGYVSLPEVTRANRNYISLFINGRYIKNFLLSKAIVDGYRSKLMVGRFPIAVIAIETDYLLVDVNVHPTKQQVRLSKEAHLADLITQAIDKAMQAAVRIPEAEPLTKRQTQKSEQLNLLTPQRNDDEPRVAPVVTEQHMPTPEADKPLFSSQDELEPPVQVNAQQADDASNDKVLEPEAPSYQAHVPEATPTFPSLDYIGQFHGTYLLASDDVHLYLIDQHAAQERIKYEYYREALAEEQVDQQGLLLPLVLSFSADEYLRLADKMTVINRLGFLLEPFGTNSYMLQSFPVWFTSDDTEGDVREVLTRVLRDRHIDIGALRQDLAIQLSCKRSIKANHHLEPTAARQLLNDLAQTSNPYNCPHGRPVLVKLSTQEIARLFKRIQDTHESRDWQDDTE